MFSDGYGMEDFSLGAYDDADSRDPTIDGFNYDRNSSNNDVSVYKDPGTKKAVVAFRGTSKGEDIRPDIGIATNNFKNTTRFKESNDSLKQIINKYGKDNIRLTGHSLGGKSASLLAKKYGIKADTFNKGSTPLQLQTDLVKNLGCKIFNSDSCKADKLVTNHLVIGDPISTWSMFSNQNNKYYTPKGINPHSLSNFEGLDI